MIMMTIDRRDGAHIVNKMSAVQFIFIHIYVYSYLQRSWCLGNGGTYPGCEDGSWSVSNFYSIFPNEHLGVGVLRDEATDEEGDDAANEDEGEEEEIAEEGGEHNELVHVMQDNHNMAITSENVRFSLLFRSMV